MKRIMAIVAAAAVCAASLPSAKAREREYPRAWEFGIGGSLSNLNRTIVSGFQQTAGGDYVFNLDEKALFGGPELYLAVELKKWMYLDVQGNLGVARWTENGADRRGWALMAGPGLQIRPFTRSEWIVPFFRVGIDGFHKTFPTTYFGQFEGDPTKEASWVMEDAWNKGMTTDANSFIPVSAGLGAIGWLGNKIGIRLQAAYHHSLGINGANFATGTVGLVLRLGGDDKRKNIADKYNALHPLPVNERTVEVIKEVEVPVETIREVVKEVPVERTLAELMESVHFEFDRAVITRESQSVIDDIAKILNQFPDDRFLVAGYTDAVGSDQYNDNLSEERAKAVHDALIERGVSEGRLAYRGFGKRMALVAATESEELRKADRKVVLERVASESLWNIMCVR